jgi:CBS-domain-containing membrane protein
MTYNYSMNISSKELKVQDIMSPCQWQVDENTPLEDIYPLFAREQLQCVPVVDENKRLQGCIFMSDLERSRQLFDLREYLGIISAGLDENVRQQISLNCLLDEPIDLKAREIMSVRLLKVFGSDDISTLSRSMVEQGTHFALVVEGDGQVKGTVTSLDILKAL